jgi:hypothetical protein
MDIHKTKLNDFARNRKQKYSNPDSAIEWIVKTDDDISVDWTTFADRLSRHADPDKVGVAQGSFLLIFISYEKFSEYFLL